MKLRHFNQRKLFTFDRSLVKDSSQGQLTSTCQCLNCCCSIGSIRHFRKGSILNQPQEFKGNDDNNLRIDDILDRNKAWVKGMKEKDPFYFHKLSLIQKPKLLYFGCSDSRVPANDILGLRPGDVYVHRHVK